MTPKPLTIKCQIKETDTITLSVDLANPQDVLMDWTGFEPAKIIVRQAAARKLCKALWVYMHTEIWPCSSIESVGVSTSEEVALGLEMGGSRGNPRFTLLYAGRLRISIYLNQKLLQDLTKFLGEVLT